jgi:FAD-linked sulfhydryl oxidase
MEKNKEDCVEYVCEKEDPLKRYRTYHRIAFDDEEDSSSTDSKSTAKSDQKPSASQTEKVPKGKSEEKDPYNDCPIARDALGYYSWNLLHTMAIYYPEKPSDTQKDMMKHFITAFAEFYPCKACAGHFKKDIKQGNFSHLFGIIDL